MAKEKKYTGYAIVSKDIFDDKVFKRGDFGICLTDRSLETCKDYCNRGYVVVRTYRALLGKSFSVKWTNYSLWDVYRIEGLKCLQLGHLRFECETLYYDRYERVAVYDPEDQNTIPHENV